MTKYEEHICQYLLLNIFCKLNSIMQSESIKDYYFFYIFFLRGLCVHSLAVSLFFFFSTSTGVAPG